MRGPIDTDLPGPLDGDGRVSVAYAAYATALHRFAASRSRDPNAADDIVQEAFLRLALEARTRGFPREPRAWLYRVAANLIVSRARHAAVARRQVERDRIDVAFDDSPETSFLAAERWRSLGVALDAARPDGRQGLVMAAEGYSAREIALTLGRTEAATRTLLCRARKDVRRRLSSAQRVVA